MTIRSSRRLLLIVLPGGVLAGAIILYVAVRAAASGAWLVAVFAAVLAAGGIAASFALSLQTTLTADPTTVRLQPPRGAVIVAQRQEIASLVRSTPGRWVPFDLRDRSGRLLLRIPATFEERDLREFARYLGLTWP